MKRNQSLLLAFLLNLGFSIFELLGGILTGSVAILSDALHDVGDAAGIGISFFLENKSKKHPDENHTYGYLRYSALGAWITTSILLIGSCAVIYHAVLRLLHPTPIRYNEMILFAVVGVLVNLCAVFFTRRGSSLNQKAIFLHMLEDALGWIVVLAGAVVMKLTNLTLFDPILSICVSLWILFHAFQNAKEILDLFLEKTPREINIHHIKMHLLSLDGVSDVHHIHVWSMDGQIHYATMHVVCRGNGDRHALKERLRKELSLHSIAHVTLELEDEGEPCHERSCHVLPQADSACHHHHHHH